MAQSHPSILASFVWTLISLSSLSLSAANFQEGEFVPTARRAQFHQVSHACLSRGVIPTLTRKGGQRL